MIAVPIASAKGCVMRKRVFGLLVTVWVASWLFSPAAQAQSTPAKPSADKPAASQPTVLKTGTAYASTKSKADKVDAPVLAVTIWEKFLDTKPAGDDLTAANAELARWKDLQKNHAEKINGKWVGGAERKKLLKEVDELVGQGMMALRDNQTMDGIKKFEAALKLYPQSFAANFELGYFYLGKGLIGSNGQGNLQYMKKAISSLEMASKIMPNSAATWSNLAIGYNFDKKYQRSVEAAYKAAKIRESKETVQNLVNSIAFAPRSMQFNNAAVKPIMEDTIVIARRHGISLDGAHWVYVRPDGENTKSLTDTEDGDTGPAGAAWSGSGFFITDDGYFLTNRHVVTGDLKGSIRKDIAFRARMDDGTEMNAEVIAIDEKADIALMKLKVDKPVEFLKIADANPRMAAKALVLGYPDTGYSDPSLQISEGQVKSLHEGENWEVWFDLNTTHGNSGGPIVDRNCRVISILTGGHQDSARVIYYVHGTGPMQIKRFLDTLGDKAPKIEYVPTAPGDFDGESLTEKARKATLWVLAVRTGEGEKKP